MDHTMDTNKHERYRMSAPENRGGPPGTLRLMPHDHKIARAPGFPTRSVVCKHCGLLSGLLETSHAKKIGDQNLHSCQLCLPKIGKCV